MPLRKLWNSLCGRRNAESASDRPSNTSLSAASDQGKAGAAAVAKPRKSAGILSISMGGENAAVAKLAKKVDPKPDQPLRVLEIGVGDGKRCLAIVAGLTVKRSSDQLQYSVIDTFEMGDGPITMRDFNKLARDGSVKPQLFPMPVDAGLMRLAHTLGSVDLILDGEGYHATEDGFKLLDKVMHPATVLLSMLDGKWQVVDRPSASGKRKQAA